MLVGGLDVVGVVCGLGCVCWWLLYWVCLVVWWLWVGCGLVVFVVVVGAVFVRCIVGCYGCIVTCVLCMLWAGCVWGWIDWLCCCYYLIPLT